MGPVAPKSCTEIRISIKMPTVKFPDDKDRYVLEYEMRHSYQTIMIGVPIKLCILMIRDEPDEASPQNLMQANGDTPNCNRGNEER